MRAAWSAKPLTSNDIVVGDSLNGVKRTNIRLLLESNSSVITIWVAITGAMKRGAPVG